MPKLRGKQRAGIDAVAQNDPHVLNLMKGSGAQRRLEDRIETHRPQIEEDWDVAEKEKAKARKK